MDIEGKIKKIREPKWINYSDAVDIIKELNDLKNYPKSSRMPKILLVGDSNNGKTALIEKFVSLNPATFSQENNEMECSVIAVQAHQNQMREGFIILFLKNY